MFSLILRSPRDNDGGIDVAVGAVSDTERQKPAVTTQRPTQQSTRLVVLTSDFHKRHKHKLRVVQVYIRYDVAASQYSLGVDTLSPFPTICDSHLATPGVVLESWCEDVLRRNGYDVEQARTDGQQMLKLSIRAPTGPWVSTVVAPCSCNPARLGASGFSSTTTSALPPRLQCPASHVCLSTSWEVSGRRASRTYPILQLGPNASLRLSLRLGSPTAQPFAAPVHVQVEISNPQQERIVSPPLPQPPSPRRGQPIPADRSPAQISSTLVPPTPATATTSLVPSPRPSAESESSGTRIVRPSSVLAAPSTSFSRHGI